MLEVSNLQVNAQATAILQGIHAHFPAGKISALLGANGAGKSTLLKCLAGDQAFTGNIALDGQSIALLPARQRAQRVGVLPQASSLAFPFTAREVVGLGATPLSLSRAELGQRISDIMAQCHCLEQADQPYPRLSGGEKQRVQLARVLLQISDSLAAPESGPSVLLLDEPTSAQDLGQQHHLLASFRQLANNHNLVVVAVLHDLNQVLRYCDHCVLLDKGALSDSGHPQQLLTPDCIARHWHYRPTEAHSQHGRVLV